jgi:PTS system mannose-specific IIB component/fructoselysine and glucoselysine-specific PTS system IIB component
MPVALFRIDDRLVHGQVVVGWGQPLKLGFIVLADDDVAAEEWEQELYRMGVPPNMELVFATVDDAARSLERYRADARPGIVLTGTVDAMLRLVRAAGPGAVRTVNVGGIHHRDDRAQKLRYVFLTPDEETGLRALEAAGVTVTAQDVPSARAVPLAEILRGEQP